jgi:hypothetical protein
LGRRIEKLVAALGGFPLGQQSSHLRADQLTVPSGHKRSRNRAEPSTRASMKAGLDPAL